MIGIDEVGRGAWAGPLLVVAARQKRDLPKGLKDSKKLSVRQRVALYDHITTACDLGEGWVTASEIDGYGLVEAMRMAVARALYAIDAKSDEEIIMDGLINFCDPSFLQVACIARADDSYPLVSAASIYAKVTRDRYMAKLDGSYALYGFAKHVGYGTKMHMEKLTRYGISDMHRVSFAPIKKIAHRQK
jgi:ribonuclease HII